LQQEITLDLAEHGVQVATFLGKIQKGRGPGNVAR
jgi:hypothetical protein